MSVLLAFSQPTLSEEETGDSYAGALRVVQELHTVLLKVMQAGNSMEFSERYLILEPTVTESFDTPAIAKVILSRYWKNLTPQQQEGFVSLFNQQTIATYASRFNSFDNDVFKIITTKKLKKDRILVRTEIQSNSESSIKLDYLMHKNNKQWFIISVIADGVNDLSLKRAEYSTIIKNNGYEKLVKDIEKKIANIMERVEIE